MPVKRIWIPCCLLLLVALSFPPRNMAAGIYYVKSNATGTNNGSSWSNAYTDLQSALAVAHSGEEIWVAAGTYKPTSGTDRTKSFVLLAGVGLYGGFKGTEASREQRTRQAHETILSGDIGVPGNKSDNSLNIVTATYMAVLDGFTITGGNNTSYSGGGLFNNNSSSLTVSNCIFSGNYAIDGGGMSNLGANANPIVNNCLFLNNSAKWAGGGMHNQDGATPTVTDCSFTSNSSSTHGGGMSNTSGASPKVRKCRFLRNSVVNGLGGGMSNTYSNTSPTVFECIFSSNTAASGGGINIFNGAAPSVANCLFTSNSASFGGGMFVDNASPSVFNCTFLGNTVKQYGGGIFNTRGSPTLTNCILWSNAANYGPEGYTENGALIFRYCDIRGGVGTGTDGGGNIMSDPHFFDSFYPAGSDGIWMTTDDGLRLQVDSPCINKGLSSGAPKTDILGKSRTGLPDIGAYEYLPNDVAIWVIYD